MKNKILYFNYQKDSGEKSNRRVISISEPSNLLLCLDITNEDLYTNDINYIRKKLENIENQRWNDIYELTTEFGIKDKIKTFKQKGISNIVDNTEVYKTKKDTEND